jgi:hypothetical protein
VQGISALKPLVGVAMDGPGDGAVLKPLPESRMGCAFACGAAPRYGLLDPAEMAMASIDEALPVEEVEVGQRGPPLGEDQNRTQPIGMMVEPSNNLPGCAGPVRGAAARVPATKPSFDTPCEWMKSATPLVRDPSTLGSVRSASASASAKRPF